MKNPFPLFHAAYPPGEPRVSYDKRYDPVGARVPAAVADEWRSFGFGNYGGGLLWTTPPDRPVLRHDDWPFLDGDAIEIVRTAFANVCLWHHERFVWLNVHSGKRTVFNPDAEVMFDSSLIEKHFRKAVLLEALFRKAVRRFGALQADECFGFAPLPALGGTLSEEYLIKTNLRDYVSVAGQMLPADAQAEQSHLRDD